jgi:Sec-independent protein translocase TatC
MLGARAGFVTASGLRKGRKYAIVAIFVFAAFVTPPRYLESNRARDPAFAAL